MTNQSSSEDTPLSEERLRLALDAAAVGMWDFNPKTGRLVWDDRCRAVFGLPPDAPVDYGVFLAGLHPDDRDVTDEAVQQALRGENNGEYDIEYRTVGLADGGVVRWAAARGKAIFDGQGTAERFIGTIQDISARKVSEQDLRDRETRYQLVSRATRDAIWDWNLLTNSVRWNEEVSTLFLYTPDQVAPRASWWYETIHPDDRERVIAGIHRVIDGRGGGSEWSDAYRFRRADGAYAEVFDRGHVMRDTNGDAIRMIGAMQDVTERNAREREQKEAADALARSEARFRSQADAMPQMVWATDPQGNHLYYNRRWYEYTGQTVEESMGFGFALALHPDDIERTLERWRRSWQDGEDYEVEYRFRRYDGTYRWFVGRAEPIRDGETGAITMWAGTCTDIDELKRAQAELAALSQKNERIAETLQRSLLLTPQKVYLPGITVESVYEAAWDEAQIGGDFLDVIALSDNKVAFVTGDATGKGLNAASFTAQCLFSIRVFLREAPDPAQALARLNTYLLASQQYVAAAAAEADPPTFVALSVAVLDSITGELQCSAGGAEPVLVLRDDTGQAEEVASFGPLLGADAESTYENVNAVVGPGDLLVMTTDGLTEARRGRREFFGLSGVAAAAAATAPNDPLLTTTAKAVVGEAKAFAGGKLRDDVALLLVRRNRQ